MYQYLYLKYISKVSYPALTVDASFQFVDVWDLGMIDFLATNVK